MRFAAAVLAVVVFLGLSVYSDLNGQQELRWFWFVVATIAPWLVGMQFKKNREPDDDTDSN